tara:strand:- start:397 stop:894 length:498 start_codon:yes stop_codon:yes gene_type:complete
MAGFHSKTFIVYDDYMTPKYAWDNIKHLIPNNKVIWEPFYGDGKSGEYLTELGFEVIHEPVDFFENDLGDIIVSNPPFSKCVKILEQLHHLDKPFILIMPTSKIFTNYFRKHFNTPDLQIVVPRNRIHFYKKINGISQQTNKCNFDCFYYCYKLDLDRGITFLGF